MILENTGKTVDVFSHNIVDRIALGVKVIEACTVLLPRAAVITTAVLLRTNPFVVTSKVALVAPADTVTLPGTTMKELLLTNPTTVPPDGASPLKVTVPVDVPPFGMVAGLNVSIRMITLAGS